MEREEVLGAIDHVTTNNHEQQGDLVGNSPDPVAESGRQPTQAGSAVLEHELDFKRAFEAAPACHLLLDRELRILAASDRYLEATKRPRESVVGHFLFDAFPDSHDNPEDPAPTGVGNLRASLERVLQSKALDTMPLQRYDIPRPEAEGGGFEERYWSPRNSPVLIDGEVSYIVHLVEDVTDFVRLKQGRVGTSHETADWAQRVDQLEAEVFVHAQQVRQANERLRVAHETSQALLGSIRDGFYSLDRDWRFTYVTARGADLIGEPTEALVGHSLWEFFPEAPDGVLHRELGRALHEGVSVEFIYFDERTGRWLENRAYPSRFGISWLVSDVTARKTAETRLDLEYSVTRILSESASFEEAAAALLPALCGILDTQVTGLWMLDPSRQALRCAGLYSCDQSPETALFIEESRRIAYLEETSLPGRVWRSGKPLWIADLETLEFFVRRESAARAGLRSGIAFPISNGSEFFGVFEFFLKRCGQEDVTLVETMTALGSEVAQFIQRKRAEAALHASEVRYRRLFEGAQDGVLIVDAETARIADANPFMSTLLGYTREEFIGKTLWEIGLYGDEAASRAAYETVRRSGYLRSESVSIESGNGERRVVELISNLYDEDHQPVIQCNIRDITERKRAEDALHASEQRFRALVTATSDVVYQANPDWSEVRHVGGGGFVASLETPSRSWLDEFVPPEDQPRVSAAVNEAVRTRSAFELEHSVRRVDGTVGWTFSRAVPLLDTRGEIVEWFGAAIDITESKEAQAKLQQHAANLEKAVAERTAELREIIAELEAFSYSLSHDMRAPLRAIQGYVEIVLGEVGEKIGHPGTDYLRRVIGAAERLDRLIQDVLAVTRVSRSGIIVNTLDVERMVLDIINERPELQPPRAEISIDGPLLPVRAHEASLTQCLTNLLGNATKFVAAGVQPRVRLWTERHGEFVRLWVEDNGIGMDKEAQRNLFRIFSRIHTQGDYEGTGIGLAIVRRAVERMGGGVGVESEPGKGSRFWLQLPRGY